MRRETECRNENLRYRPILNLNPRLLFFCITLLCDWSRKLVPLSQPIKRKNVKPITTSTLAFPALCQFNRFYLSSYWLLKVFSFPLIGCCDYFGFGFTLSSYWLLKVFSFPLIGCCDYFGFGFTLSSYWLLKVFSFLLIGRCDYFGFGFCFS